MALHLPLFVLVLIPLLSTALATHNQISPATTTASRHHHHRSRTNTATAHFHPVPSATHTMHQNYLETEESKSLLAVDPFTAEAQASSGEEAMAALGAAATGDARPGLLVPPQASPSPPTLVAAPDLISRAQPQPQEESETNAASTTTTLLPLPNQQITSVATESPPPPIQAGVAREVRFAGEQGLQQLSRVLTSLGYHEMASAAPLLANSPPLARLPGAITVFAAPDVLLQASCPTCSRRHLLLQHIAMGYYPYSELAASPSTKIPSASAGLCVEIVSERGPFGIHYARIYAEGVEVSHPELYNDGRYVILGLHGFLRPLTHSCFNGSMEPPRRHLTVHSTGRRGLPIREAVVRLRRLGYGVVAAAMLIHFAELERFANLTVFALDDQAIFVGGGHDYVSAMRFHIVPEHRLTRADLLRLRPGTTLPTLAGEGQSLVVTHVKSSISASPNGDVRINYIPIKMPDLVMTARVVVHGMNASAVLHDPHLDRAHLSIKGQRREQFKRTRAKCSEQGIPPSAAAAMAAAAAAAAGIAGWFIRGRDGRRRNAVEAAAEGIYAARFGPRNLVREERLMRRRNCHICFDRPVTFRAGCCGEQYCTGCAAVHYVRSHNRLYGQQTCRMEGNLATLQPLVFHHIQHDKYLESTETVLAENEQRLAGLAPAGMLVRKQVYSSLEDLRAQRAAERLCVFSNEANEQELLSLVIDDAPV